MQVKHKNHFAYTHMRMYAFSRVWVAPQLLFILLALLADLDQYSYTN